MKNFLMVLALGVVTLTLAYPSQAADPFRKIPGYFDLGTSSFVPMVLPKVLPAIAPVTRIGTLRVVIHLTIQSAIGTDEGITCSSNVFASDASFDNQASSSGPVVRSGATGTVVLTMPYDWTMAATGEQATVNANCSEGTGFGSPVSHSIFFTVPGFIVPVTSGAVTTLTLTASM